jgi:hypothetical protein
MGGRSWGGKITGVGARRGSAAAAAAGGVSGEGGSRLANKRRLQLTCELEGALGERNRVSTNRNPTLCTSSGTNPYNAGIKEELHNVIIATSDYNSSAQAGYKSNRTESIKMKTPMQRIYRSEASPAPQANSSVGPALVFPPSS